MAKLDAKGRLRIPEDLIVGTELEGNHELNLWYNNKKEYFVLDLKKVEKSYELIGTVTLNSRRFHLPKDTRDVFNITKDSKILFFIKDKQLFFRIL